MHVLGSGLCGNASDFFFFFFLSVVLFKYKVIGMGASLEQRLIFFLNKNLIYFVVINLTFPKSARGHTCQHISVTP